MIVLPHLQFVECLSLLNFCFVDNDVNTVLGRKTRRNTLDKIIISSKEAIAEKNQKIEEILREYPNDKINALDWDTGDETEAADAISKNRSLMRIVVLIFEEVEERRLVSYNNEELKARKTNQWQDIGFQGDDPATDFRGMGVLGLDQLVFFAQSMSRHSRLPWIAFTLSIVVFSHCSRVLGSNAADSVMEFNPLKQQFVKSLRLTLKRADATSIAEQRVTAHWAGANEPRRGKTYVDVDNRSKILSSAMTKCETVVSKRQNQVDQNRCTKRAKNEMDVITLDDALELHDVKVLANKRPTRGVGERAEIEEAADISYNSPAESSADAQRRK
uniref:ELMO domain-containing protein n=1 Tax=Ditylenchus dipsaci TaxID=166011 RepID=A0A915E8V2_9BILA